MSDTPTILTPGTLHISVRDIASICHEANRALQRVLGQATSPTWEHAPDWQRDSAINGVMAIRKGTAATPEAQHAAWMQEKIEQGWVYGVEKDAAKKTHPCILPYASLPVGERAKDYVFRAIVESLTVAR